jgi:hypothetical protein
VHQPLFGLLYQPQVIDDECGAVGGMRIGRGNWSTQRKPTPVPLHPPQIPHVLTQAWTQAAVVGSRPTNHLSYGMAFGKHIPVPMNTHAIIEELLAALFSVRSIISKESRWLVLPRTSRKIGGPISKQVSLQKTKIWSWVLTGSESKVECTGKGQQQFTWWT